MFAATAIKVWWREAPLNEGEQDLLEQLFEAHIASAYRQNPSSITVANTADSSQDFSKAIAAGLLTLGEKHAPIEATYRFLSWEMPWDEVRNMLLEGQKIPGWGGAFQKDGPDPLWDKVDYTLCAYYLELHQKIVKVTHELHDLGKIIFPNPSAYTAATAIALGLKAKSAPYLFISSRLEAWARIADQYLTPRKEE